VQVPRKVSEIDWPGWQPREEATLVFVVSGGEMLLMRKKRGLGAGKINGPGGRIERGESSLECAVREVREELCVTPLGLEDAGENAFQFVDGYSIRVFVFRASGFLGEPAETEEGAPLWTPLDEIPYHEMWEDDRLWLPLVLSGQRFRGRFIFDGDAMLDHQLELTATAPGGGGPPRPS
jgi:8-oxo-dGTP diphosphatase